MTSRFERPSSLHCPITHEVFQDPVIAADGHTYERQAITQWLEGQPQSPCTRQVMTLDSLRPNYLVKSLLIEFDSYLENIIQ